jgi:formylglycine-generating enzyme required for sulfatase activity/energy-coupling factor transporter ATP-binding protein EcfA2
MRTIHPGATRCVLLRLPMPNAKRLFLSFNSQDREKVRTVHGLLKDRGVATFFDEQDLRAGLNWPQALQQALNDSAAVAVFVGAQMGRWQWPEIGFALDRQASEQTFPVIPVLLDNADTSRSFLFLNTWVDLRGERLSDVEALNRLIDAAAGSSASEPGALSDINPYRGLEFFDEGHAPFFFGRESFIEDLFARLTAQRKNFVAVIGASGSGKSSVVRAGLIPKLRRQRPTNPTWDVAVFTPGERPWFRLADALGPLRFPEKQDAELDIEIDKIGRALQSGEYSLQSLLERILKSQGKMHRLLLVVDQFEELFTGTPAAERSAFVEHLLTSLSVEGVVLVPTLRADFYGQAIEVNRRLSDLLGREQVTLGRLTGEELTRAIVEPARLARLDFDPGLPELLLRDAGNEPGNLPLLQHALLELYTKRNGHRLTSQAYQDIGGIRKAIANSAEREFQRLEAQGKAALARQVFTQLVHIARVDENLQDTRRRLPTAALSADAKQIVDEFAGYQLRLLVKASERIVDPGRGAGEQAAAASEQETVEVAHEALIREWGRLQQWLNEDRGFYLWRQRLDQAIKDYAEHGALPEYLLQGPALKEAEGKLAAPKPEPLSQAQEDFINASIEARDRHARAAREAEEQRQREKETLRENERKALAQARQAQDALQAREREDLTEAAQRAQQAQQLAEAAQQAETEKRKAAERAKRKWVGVVVVLLGLFGETFYAMYTAGQLGLPIDSMLSIERYRFGYTPLPAFVGIRPGSFHMGEHEVTIAKGFRLGVTEVTFDQFDYYVWAQPRDAKIKVPNAPNSGRGNRPVVNVSWREAVAYAAWLGTRRKENCRLPTEAEWEYAARAGSTTAYPWGDNVDEKQPHASCKGCGGEWGKGEQSAPVASFPANKFGLHDMSGNVWEWTCSAFQNEFDGTEQACATKEGDTSARVVRGGSWDNDAGGARSSARDFSGGPGLRNVSIGFRVLCSSPRIAERRRAGR